MNGTQDTARTWHNAGFLSHVMMNPVNRAILARWKLLDLPGSWLVAGCLFQTVWNIQAGRAPGADIGLYEGTLTPNPRTPYAQLFTRKASSYRSRWSWLTVQEGP